MTIGNFSFNYLNTEIYLQECNFNFEYLNFYEI